MGRIAPLLGLVALAVTACTGPSAGPDRTKSPTAPQTQQPEANAWDALASGTSCDSKEFQSPELPRGVAAWAALGDCAVVIAGEFGLRLIVSGEILTLADHLSGIDDVTGVAVNHDTVWISGTAARPGDGVVVQRVDRDGAHNSRLPSRADYSTGLVPYRRGVVVAVGNTATREAHLLWLSHRRAKRIGPLPSEIGLRGIVKTCGSGVSCDLLITS